MQSKIIIIYQSEGNTKFIAEEIAKQLKCNAIDVKINPNINLEQYDLVGFGSGIYFWNFGHKLKKWIRKIQWTNEEVNKPEAFIFSTQGGSNPTGAHTRFKHFLEKKHIIAISGWSSNTNNCRSPEALENLKQWLNTKVIKIGDITKN